MNPVRLMLMRHAKSDWSDESLDDFHRPLNARGLATAPRVAEWMRQNKWMPQRVLCSTAIRATQTWELMTDYWQATEPAASPIEVEFFDSLYLAQPTVILATARDRCEGTERLLVVGHNPGLEVLASALSRQAIQMPTASLAIFESHNGWPVDWRSPESWELKKLFCPRELGP